MSTSDDVMEAARTGDTCALSEMHAAGVNIAVYDEHCRSCLEIAVEHGHASTVRLLAGLGVQTWADDEYSISPIQRAVQRGHSEVVRILASYGESVDFCTGIGLIDRAVKSGDVAMVRTLVGCHAAVDGHCEPSPLCSAAGKSDVAIVHALLELRASVNAGEPTALWVAASAGGTEVTKLLLRAGADVNVEHNEETPLSVAALKGRVGVVDALMGGADIQRWDMDNAIEVAQEQEHDAVVAAFSKYRVFPRAVNLRGITGVVVASSIGKSR
jgi:ankyrin repeat protein